jgi:predicted acylesterase/phospholipase RssA
VIGRDAREATDHDRDPVHSDPASANGVRALRWRQSGRAAGGHAPSVVRARHRTRSARRHLPGALNAEYVASRPQTVATAGELARVWRGLHRDDLFPVSARTVIGGLTNHRDHLVPDRGLRQLARRHLRIERMEHATVPLHIVAFDVLSSQDVLLSDGPMLEAVLAAAAIPGVFPPVPSGDRLLVDGGVRNNTPISHAIELGAERIYVLPTADPCARTPPRATARRTGRGRTRLHAAARRPPRVRPCALRHGRRAARSVARTVTLPHPALGKTGVVTVRLGSP